MELFGLRLKALRLGKGLTQQQLADKLDIVSASVSGYEKTSFYPSVEILVKICNYFDVSADYMLGLSNSLEVTASHLTDEQVSVIMNLISQFERLNQTPPDAV